MSRKTRENVSVCANDGRVNSIAIPPFPLSALPFRFRLYFPTIRATRVYFPWKRAIRERERERVERIGWFQRGDEKAWIRFLTRAFRFIVLGSKGMRRRFPIHFIRIASENDIDRSVVT